MSINITNYDKTIQKYYEVIFFFPAYAEEKRYYSEYNKDSDSYFQKVYEGYIHAYAFSSLSILEIIFSAKKDEKKCSIIKHQESLFLLGFTIYN